MPSGPDPQRRSVTTLRSPFQRPQHWHSVFTESGRGPVGPFGFSRLWLLPAPSRGLAHQARQSLCRRAGARQPKPAAHFGPVWAYFYGAFSGCNRRAERPQAATSGGAGQRHADRHTPAGRRHADRHNPAGRDAGRYGIHVNAICPGPIESEMTPRLRIQRRRPAHCTYGHATRRRPGGHFSWPRRCPITSPARRSTSTAASSWTERRDRLNGATDCGVID
jgi:hypothetical protein